MARIRRVIKSPGLLFVGVNMSSAMHQEVIAQAAKKYNPFLKKVLMEDVLELLTGHPSLSLVRKRPFEVNVTIAEVDGKRVTLSMSLDLYACGGKSDDLEPFLRLVVKQLMPDSGILVHHGSLMGEILLPEEPYRVPTPHNGAMYFLNHEKEIALSFLEENLIATR